MIVWSGAFLCSYSKLAVSPLLLEAGDSYLSLQVRVLLVVTEQGPKLIRDSISPLLLVPGDQSCCRPEGRDRRTGREPQKEVLGGNG